MTIGVFLSFIPAGLGVSEVVTTAVLTNMGILAATAQTGALVLRAYTLIIVFRGVMLGYLYSERFLSV